MRHKFPPLWPTRSFKEVAEVITGTTPLTSHPEYYGGSIPFIGPAELGGVELITQSPKSLSDDGVKQARLLPAEAVLVCCIGATIGKVGFSGTELATNQQINALVCNKNIVFPRYVFHYCQTLTSLIRHLGASTTLPLLTKGRFQEMEIPVPILEEQRRIAEILDRAQSLISKRREAIAELDTLSEAIFIEMFGDPVTNPKGLSIKPLGDYLLFITSGGRGWAKFYAPSGSRFLRSLDVKMNCISNDDITFVSPPNNAEARRTQVKNGDVLLTITGSRIGRAAPVPNELQGAYISQHVAILRLDPKSISPLFLSFFLSFKTGGQRQIAKVQYGQTKPGLKFEQIKNFQVPIPSIDLQQEFVHRVEVVEKLKAAHRASLSELDALFASLQHRAFRGEL
ncbi:MULTISPECIES: restriction endonuclease subunit S [unclassified Microcoleus]|uniref:restriction endonuclease subunit S n=1 Tax=unclassified Microcoleus TaxID=2642155 RepID=UPI0025DCBD84|nr:MULTISPECIES: restriction endonuclease subunit S [unclassified Microcoleus]